MIKVKLTMMAEDKLVDEVMALLKKAAEEKTIGWADLNLTEVRSK